MRGLIGACEAVVALRRSPRRYPAYALFPASPSNPGEAVTALCSLSRAVVGSAEVCEAALLDPATTGLGRTNRGLECLNGLGTESRPIKTSNGRVLAEEIDDGAGGPE